MGIYSGLAAATVFGKGEYLKPGEYLLRIDKCHNHTSTRNKASTAFIAEMTVLESAGEGATAPGLTRNWFQKLDDTSIAFPALKEFAYAVLGFDYATDKEKCIAEVDPIIETVMTEASEKNGFAGDLVRVRVFVKKTAKKQLDFSVHAWGPATEADKIKYAKAA